MAVYVPYERRDSGKPDSEAEGQWLESRSTGWRSDIRAVLPPAPGRTAQHAEVCRAILRATRAAHTARSTRPAPSAPGLRSERTLGRAGSTHETCERLRAGPRSPAALK